MKLPDLTHPIAATIHARPPQPTTPVWAHSPERRKWCILRTAEPAHAAVALCLASLPRSPLDVRTSKPHNTCPACDRELAAMTPGAAVAVSRTVTPDLRRPLRLEVDALADGEWEDK